MRAERGVHSPVGAPWLATGPRLSASVIGSIDGPFSTPGRPV